MAHVFFFFLAETKPNISKYIKKSQNKLKNKTGMSVLRIPDAHMRAFCVFVCVCVGDEASGWKVLQYGPRSIFTKAFYRLGALIQDQ